jgi:hypothetical protein
MATHSVPPLDFHDQGSLKAKCKTEQYGPLLGIEQNWNVSNRGISPSRAELQKFNDENHGTSRRKDRDSRYDTFRDPPKDQKNRQKEGTILVGISGLQLAISPFP